MKNYNEQAQQDMKMTVKYVNKMQSAKSSGKTFNLTFDDYSRVMSVPTCAYSGKKFDRNNKSTLERINPTIGYERDNVIAVSSKANTQKSLLDKFIHCDDIKDDMKIKLLQKAIEIISTK